MRGFLLAFLLPLMLAAQVKPTPAAKLFSDFLEAYLRQNPELDAYLGRTDYDDRWTDWSAAGIAARADLDRQYLARLKKLSTRRLSSDEKMNASVLQYGLETDLEAVTLGIDGMMRISQVYGLQSQVYQTIGQMPASTVKDYGNIIARLNAIPAYVDQHIAMFQAAVAKGMVQPKLVVNLTLQQFATDTAEDAAATPLLGAFARFPAAISAADQAKLKQQGNDAYEKAFRPAWRKLQAFLGGDYLAKARDTTGLNAILGGDKIYSFLIRSNTTTSQSPKDIYNLGVSEVARIEGEMQAVAKQTGFTGDLGAFESNLDGNPAQRFGSRDEMLVYSRNLLKKIEPQLVMLFKTLPRSPLGVRPVAAELEASQPSHYTPGTPDLTRSAWVEVNTYQPEKQYKYGMTALLLHEGVPGHHIHISLLEEATNLPDFRKLFSSNTAFLEGWAVYAEGLGTDIGMYDDPYDRYGGLSSERFRAVRLVVDTGLHALGWSRDQAIQYFKDHAPSESVSEIDRYIAMPGQALAYKIGQLRFRDLRTTATQKLGAKFDLRQFHDVVLRNGVIPLDLLTTTVNQYIASGGTSPN